MSGLDSPQRRFVNGDRVVKNAATWIVNAFDDWGRGIGVGVVVEPPFFLEPETVDVRWPSGRCFEATAGLLPAPPVEETQRAMRQQELRYAALMPALLADLGAMAEAPRMRFQGDMRPEYHEACVWVLLDDQRDARAALIAMRPVLARHQALWPDTMVTLTFFAFENGRRYDIGHLEGDEIHDVGQLQSLSASTSSEPMSALDRAFWGLDENTTGATKR